jgi:uncharacterized protein YcbX
MNTRSLAAFRLAPLAGVGQSGPMSGRIAALFRHPVKGFTPERLVFADLAEGGWFPCDRIYAVEDGPSGFDPAAPAFTPKIRFAVLAKIADVANVRTTYNEADGVLAVEAGGRPPERFRLSEPEGREAFAGWLQQFLGDGASGPLKVQSAPGHRFTDHPQGHVSIINLASVRDLEYRLGKPVDPLRFRANIYVEGWSAWAENAMVGATLNLGDARAEVFKTIVRCTATEVDPATGERDLPVPSALFHHYGQVVCGLYVTVTKGGRVTEGDELNP